MKRNLLTLASATVLAFSMASANAASLDLSRADAQRLTTNATGNMGKLILPALENAMKDVKNIYNNGDANGDREFPAAEEGVIDVSDTPEVMQVNRSASGVFTITLSGAGAPALTNAVISCFPGGKAELLSRYFCVTDLDLALMSATSAPDGSKSLVSTIWAADPAFSTTTVESDTSVEPSHGGYTSMQPEG